ncbi:MAG: cyclic nucleotide-binding domain-containing protein [Deltaproteobacteria bacterium]|nr:cyclic nucleotide-binding domain-containing protein [Deltaproteobacteria bacterium]
MNFTPLEDYIKQNCSADVDLKDPAFQMQRYRKNDVIFSEGSKGTAAYVLKAGRVEISVKARGRKVVLTVLREQSVFGEMALILEAHKRTATATALEDSEIAKIPKSVFDNCMKDSPKFISTCLIAIARRLQDTTDKASTNPDIFMGVAQILNLFWEHGQRELSYEKTIMALWKALSKGKAQITSVITMMENLNLLRVQDGEDAGKTIRLIGEKNFMERAMSIHQLLENYSTADENV